MINPNISTIGHFQQIAMHVEEIQAILRMFARFPPRHLPPDLGSLQVRFRFVGGHVGSKILTRPRDYPRSGGAILQVPWLG